MASGARNSGTQIKGYVFGNRSYAAGRRHCLAGSPTKADAWTFDTFLMATQDRHKGDRSVRQRRWHDGDNVETAGAIF